MFRCELTRSEESSVSNPCRTDFPAIHSDLRDEAADGPDRPRESAPEGMDFLPNQWEHVRGRRNPDQSYCRTSLVRMLPIGVGGDG
jgi:hypothetical protein